GEGATITREPVILSVIRANGDEAVIELTLSLIQFPQLEGRYVLAIIREVADRQQTAEGGRRSATLPEQEQLLDLASDAIIIRDLEESQILLWNRRAEELYGWTKDEALGKSSHELLRSEFPQPLQEIESELIWKGT